MAITQITVDQLQPAGTVNDTDMVPIWQQAPPLRAITVASLLAQPHPYASISTTGAAADMALVTDGAGGIQLLDLAAIADGDTLTGSAVDIGDSLSGAVAIDIASGSYLRGRIRGATTFTTTGTLPAGKHRTTILDLRNGGAHAVTWPAAWKWTTGSAPTLQAGGRDLIAIHTTDSGAAATAHHLGGYSVPPEANGIFHFDGALTNASVGGSITLTSTNATFEAVAGAFGGTALKCGPGMSEVLTSGFNFAANQDFTIELRTYETVASSPQQPCRILSSGPGDPEAYFRTQGEHMAFYIWSDGFTALNNNVTNQWIHWRIERKGQTLSLWKNGVKTATSTSAGNAIAFNIGRIGSRGSNDEMFRGYIDELRVIIGVAESNNAATAAVPTGPYS